MSAVTLAEPREQIAARRRRRHAETLAAAAAAHAVAADAQIERCGGCGRQYVETDADARCPVCVAAQQQRAERRDEQSRAELARVWAEAEQHRVDAVSPAELRLLMLDEMIVRCSCGVPRMRRPYANVEHRCGVCAEHHPVAGLRCTLPRGHDGERHIVGPYGEASAWITS